MTEEDDATAGERRAAEGPRSRIDELFEEQSKRIDALERAQTKRIDRLIRFVAAAIVVLTITNAVSLKGNHDQGEDVKNLVEAQATAVRAQGRLVVAIQSERRRNTLLGCREQNRKNAVAYRFLKALPRSPNEPQRSPEEREKLLRGFTDALVGPARDCAKVVAELAPSTTKPPPKPRP